MSKVIKVKPLLLLPTETGWVEPKQVINISPQTISIVDELPAIDIEPDLLLITPILAIDVVLNMIDLNQTVTSYEEFLSIIREIIIRFDTNPKKYEREDFLKLILAITACFTHLYNLDISAWTVVQWSLNPSDEKVPTEKLVKDTIDRIDSILTWKSNNALNQKLIDFINIVDDLLAYNTAKTLYPNATIFFQSTSSWIIYANGLEYNFSNFGEFSDIKYRVAQLEEDLLNVLQKDNIDLISVNNGAHLVFLLGDKLKVKLNLATLTSNGALSSTDKVKIDSLGWVSF